MVDKWQNYKNLKFFYYDNQFSLYLYRKQFAKIADSCRFWNRSIGSVYGMVELFMYLILKIDMQ